LRFTQQRAWILLRLGPELRERHRFDRDLIAETVAQPFYSGLFGRANLRGDPWPLREGIADDHRLLAGEALGQGLGQASRGQAPNFQRVALRIRAGPEP